MGMSIEAVACTELLNIDDRQNMWITWAKKTGQESFCLSLATPSDPFRTCLIGVSVVNYTKIYHNANTRPKNVSSLQELRLLGSVATNDSCFKFHGNGSNLSPVRFYNYSLYCNGTAHIYNPRNLTVALPEGIFLICGDRAWRGIPANASGGPCYLGRITMFAPNITAVITANHNRTRHRRAVSQLGPDCKDTMELWDPPEVILASIFAPGVATSQALTQLRRLACWTGKQINITSNILADLTLDVEGVRHAVLQNRAAIEFLLLAQGHGCEEFEGMCCMNLSDHSNSIHRQLAQLRDNMHKLQVTSDPFTNWLASFGFSPWLMSLAKLAFLVL